jgi:predicted dehydrogenase
MNRKLRVAIAGAGQMGLAHAAAYQANGAEIVAVTDHDLARAQHLAHTFGGRAGVSLDEVFGEGPDALSICLPHSLHFDVAMKAVARGVAILIEKPHCVTLEESRALRKACKKHGVLAMAGFTHRFLATSRHLKEVIDTGRLGRIELAVDRLIAGSLRSNHPAWYRQRALAGGGITMIGMIHSIDRLRWLIGSEITSVMALTRESDPNGDVESTSLALLTFANGAQAALVAHRSPVPGHQRAHHYELFGEHLNAYCSVGSFADQQLRFVGSGELENRTVQDDEPFVAEINEFLSALGSGRSVRPDLLEAEIALGVVLAVYESAKTGQPVSTRELGGDRAPLSPNSSTPHA